MYSSLTREQFDILTLFVETKATVTEQQIEASTGYEAALIDKAVCELSSLQYISGGKITALGLAALEPYRVKRAIFIAAGFGSRLVPITLNTPKPLVRVHGERIIDSLIDACLEAGIEEIYIVRGYLSEQFDQLLYKYPMIQFLENPAYKEANNISSALVARYKLANAYVFEADLLLSNPKIIKKYHYNSNFLAIKKKHTDDWCFEVQDGVIIKEKVGGDNCWQMVGISYWNYEDGQRLTQDIADVYALHNGKESYWEQVPLVYAKEHYVVGVRECFDEDILEIDTFDELKDIDKNYII